MIKKRRNEIGTRIVRISAFGTLTHFVLKVLGVKIKKKDRYRFLKFLF